MTHHSQERQSIFKLTVSKQKSTIPIVSKQASIMQSVGYEGMITQLSQGTSSQNQKSLISKDSKRTRRSQEQPPDVKKKKFQRLKNQKQYSKKGAGLSKYRGNSDENDENMPLLTISFAPRLKNGN